MAKIGIYIHIPFCKRGCFYCHFVKREYDSDLVDKYIDALTREIKSRANPDYIIDTIYIGGGSPSLLNERQVTVILDAVYDTFNVDESIELTIEMNPEDVTKDKLRFLKNEGINRLSLGTQSFIPGDLEYLKRTHTVTQSVDSIKNALQTGFTTMNIDFITSLPTQTKESLSESVSILKTFDIPHVSAYLLEEVEEGEIKDARDNELYFFMRDLLAELGYEHYEVSNFSKPGYRSRHNLKYWQNESYIGVGLSASGFENGEDYKNTVSLDEYLMNNFQSERRAPDINLRRIVMGLRLVEGISAIHFERYKKELDFLVSNGMLNRCESRIMVNPGKILLLNEILTYF